MPQFPYYTEPKACGHFNSNIKEWYGIRNKLLEKLDSYS
jgi:hypothetical protein